MRQPPIEGLTQRDVTLLPGSPDLKATNKDFLDFVGSECMPSDMGDVVIVPVESGDDHTQ